MCEAKYDFLTVRDIQRTLKIGTNVAYNLIHSKAFPVIKIAYALSIFLPEWAELLHRWELMHVRSLRL